MVCEIIIENGDVCCDLHPSLRVYAEFTRGQEGSSLDNWWQRRDHLAEGKRSQ